MGFIQTLKDAASLYKELRAGNLELINKTVTSPTSGKAVKIPKGRLTLPSWSNNISLLKEDTAIVNIQYNRELVPLIRRLFIVNENVSLAVSDLTQLSNPGHSIQFDNSVKPEQAVKMREHIATVSQHWAPGCAGLHGIINKMIMQMFIGGAISVEAIPNKELTGLHLVAFINPEEIEFGYDKTSDSWDFYQVPRYGWLNRKKPEEVRIKLNPITYQYYGLFSDTEIPYGVPPFIAALDDLATHKDMVKNIAFIVSQIGLMGFIQLLLDKPPQNTNESETVYRARLEALLTESKTNLMGGVKDGVLVGFSGDHEYDFHSVTKNIGGLPDVYELIHRLVASGLKYSSAFMGMGSQSETQIGIVFTKMLSQLVNVQAHSKMALEHIIGLELLLAGFNFKNVTVKFEQSTITDRVKHEQAREYQIRNDRTLYADGIISHQAYAEDMGYDQPDNNGPRVPIDPDGVAAKEAARKKENEGDNTGDRKARARSKPQPKSKPQDTRER